MDTTMLAATTQAAYVEKIHTLIWVYMPIFLVFIYIKMIPNILDKVKLSCPQGHGRRMNGQTVNK